MSFVHLHCHTHYSLLDGLPKPKDYILRARSQGAPAVAITDHGNLYGAVEFYKAAKSLDMKPIIGIETYTANTDRFSKQAGVDNSMGHMILLARDYKGYENLMALSSKAFLEGFYYKPRIDMGLLKEHGEGLVLLTGCLNGDIPKALLAGDDERAKQLLDLYRSIVGSEHVFLELQSHPQILEQGLLNERLVEFGQRYEVPLVGTNDCHFLERGDKEAHDTLLCIQTGSQVHEEDRFKMTGDFHLASPDEMKEAFANYDGAVENTLEIASMCDLEIPLGKNLLPSFTTPKNQPADAYLRELCEEGLVKRYGDSPTQAIRDRLDYELDVIHRMGFDTYFLIVHDFVQFAKDSGVLVGPGRGSAAGSIVAYCLRITDIDPMKYNLLFERFLNPERISMPDIDIDFADNRRDDVLNYVVEKYGKDHVAQIITFGTMAARAAVRDVGRALGVPYGDVDQIAKLIPARPGVKLQDALEEEVELKRHYDANPTIKKLLDLALRLEGVVRHASVHACAVVISDQPVVKHAPLQLAPGGQEAVITQYSMHDIEAIGLLKMDFLGLKNLTILDYAMKIIQRTKGVSIDLEALPLDDKKTFELMARGDTTGVFQFESAGMRRYLKELEPTRFEDLIAMNALYRPGPMDWIPDYIKGKHNPAKVSYLHSSFKSILEETYGIAVYQEQVLQLAQLFAGYSLGEADILRKAVGKKIASLLAEQRSKFIEGAISKGHSKKFAVEVFDKVIEPFAGYGFNKAHATCYAMIAYRTAYLKSHYPAEFMAALMTSDRDNTDRIVLEINEAESMGIRVLPPSINHSMANFTVVNDQEIRFGLAAIKGVGIGTVREILSVREEGGPFKDLGEFCRRVPYSLLNKKTLEALAYSGALDDLAERHSVVASLEEISVYARSAQKEAASNQTDIFSMLPDEDQTLEFKIVDATPMRLLPRLNLEKQYLGLYVSGHPLQGLSRYLGRKFDLIHSLSKKRSGQVIQVAGILQSVKRITTKKGSAMAYLVLEDETGRLEVTVFPNTFQRFREFLVEDGVLLVSGKVELRRGSLQLICQEVQTISLEGIIHRAKESHQYDPSDRFVPPSQNSLEEEESEVSAEMGTESSPKKPVSPSLPYVIELSSDQYSAELLRRLKELLLSFPGESSVEIHIPSGGMIKRIKVPFGVNLSSNFEREVSGLVKVSH